MSEYTIHCPFCGSLVESSSDFCHNCGAVISESPKTGNYSTGYATTTPTNPTSGSSYSSSPSSPNQFGASYSEYQKSQTQKSQTIYKPRKSSSSDSSGTLALIFGILACVGVLPCIGSIIAIVVGSTAKKSGDSAGEAGFILGWLSMCLHLGAFILLFLLT